MSNLSGKGLGVIIDLKYTIEEFLKNRVESKPLSDYSREKFKNLLNLQYTSVEGFAEFFKEVFLETYSDTKNTKFNFTWRNFVLSLAKNDPEFKTKLEEKIYPDLETTSSFEQTEAVYTWVENLFPELFPTFLTPKTCEILLNSNGTFNGRLSHLISSSSISNSDASFRRYLLKTLVSLPIRIDFHIPGCLIKSKFLKGTIWVNNEIEGAHLA